MSKIYEALRQHQHKPITERDEPSLSAPVPSQALVAGREMQALYRSVEAVIGERSAGVMLMFASAHPGEGKSTICAAFGATLAQNFGKTVLILDGDRNHPHIKRFGAASDSSVLTLAKAPETVAQSAKRLSARGSIAVIPITSFVGFANADSPELDMLASIKSKLTSAFDYLLLDVPSLADVSWLPAIGRMADGVILVVEAERTRWPVAKNAKLEFEASGAKVIGAFLNKRKFYIPSRVYQHL